MSCCTAAVFGAIASSIAIAASAQGALGQVVSSASRPWAVSASVKGYSSTTRLVAGAEGEAGRRTILAGVEIKLNEGWKTYWRHPGDAGGVPPTFDWAGSVNLASARVMFPVPDRLVDPNGISIGYKKSVVFPVEITPVDRSLPVSLKLHFEYGICREICVPAEARMDVTIPAEISALPPEVSASLARVPRGIDRKLPTDPQLKSASATLSGKSPSVIFDIMTASAGAAAELYVEAPGGVYLPQPERAGPPSAGVQRFKIDLAGVDEIDKLKGKTLLMTIAGPAGGAEVSWVVK